LIDIKMICTSILLITAFVVMANSMKSQIKEISHDQKRSPSSVDNESKEETLKCDLMFHFLVYNLEIRRCHYRPTNMINECCTVTLVNKKNSYA
ncbi:hypothetical protein AM593_10443, partial [Mytilus galloprovincialis]